MNETGMRLLKAHSDLKSARENLTLAIKRHKVTERVKNSPVTWMRMHRASVMLSECTEAVEHALHSLQIHTEEP